MKYIISYNSQDDYGCQWFLCAVSEKMMIDYCESGKDPLDLSTFHERLRKSDDKNHARFHNIGRDYLVEFQEDAEKFFTDSLLKVDKYSIMLHLQGIQINELFSAKV